MFLLVEALYLRNQLLFGITYRGLGDLTLPNFSIVYQKLAGLILFSNPDQSDTSDTWRVPCAFIRMYLDIRLKTIPVYI